MIFGLLPLRAWLYAGLMAALLALAGWWHMSRVHAAEQAVHAHYAKVLGEISAKTAKAETEFRATETAWRTAFDKEARDGREKITAARADAAAAHVAGERMRDALTRYRAAARATEGAIAAQRSQGELDPSPIDLCAGMLERHTRDLEIVGGFADELRARGLTCERSADSLAPPALPASGPTGARARP